MGAAIHPDVRTPDDGFWERLHHLEARQQTLQAHHERLRRTLDALSSSAMEDELRETWKRYCEVVTELEIAADEFASLRFSNP